MGDTVEPLKRQLEIHRGNLHKLEEQAACYGLNVPLDIQNAIEHEKKAIARLQKEIGELEEDLEQVVARGPLYKNAAEHLEEVRKRGLRERIPVLDRPLMKVLCTRVFQVGAIVAVLTFVAITWFWTDIRRTFLLLTTPTAIPTSIAAVMGLADARVSFTITPSDGPPLKVPSGGTLTLTPGEAVLIETSITVGQSSFPRDLTYEYVAPVGSIPKGLVGPRTSYVAPDRPGPDFITVLITDLGTDDGILRSINVVVKKSP